MKAPPAVLTVAGSDPSGGAGIQADLKVFADYKLRGHTVVTALTLQDARSFSALNPIPSQQLQTQFDRLPNIPLAGIKIGMLATAENVTVVARFLRDRHTPWVVLDPVFRSTTGADLLDDRGKLLLQEELLPLINGLTPNLDEASFFISSQVRDLDDMKKAALMIGRTLLGPTPENKFVAIKGGDLQGDPTDLLFDGQTMEVLPGKRIPGGPFHGTGCRFSSALLANLVLGLRPQKAAEAAKQYGIRQIQSPRHPVPKSNG